MPDVLISLIVVITSQCESTYIKTLSCTDCIYMIYTIFVDYSTVKAEKTESGIGSLYWDQMCKGSVYYMFGDEWLIWLAQMWYLVNSLLGTCVSEAGLGQLIKVWGPECGIRGYSVTNSFCFTEQLNVQLWEIKHERAGLRVDGMCRGGQSSQHGSEMPCFRILHIHRWFPWTTRVSCRKHTEISV